MLSPSNGDTRAMAEERVQRRLAAILAADVAGYSRLMGVDEEGNLSALKELGAVRSWPDAGAGL